jgi:uncharacterized membrane protein
MNNDFVRNTVESTLQADMDRFKVYALKELPAYTAQTAAQQDS